MGEEPGHTKNMHSMVMEKANKMAEEMKEMLGSPDSRWTVITDRNGAKMRLSEVDGHYVFPSFTIEECVRVNQKEFQARESDVWLITYPRSGTHWVWEMINMLKDDHLQLGPPMFKEQYQLEFTNAGAFDEDPSPRFLNTHLPVELMPPSVWEQKSKMIVVMRNARDVAVSNYLITLVNPLYKYTGTWDGWFELFMNGKVDRGSWFDYVLDWWIKGRGQDNFLFVKYEDMKRDTLSEMRKIAKFLGYEKTDKYLQDIVNACSFENMKKVDAASTSKLGFNAQGENIHVKKGKVGRWREYFSEDQLKEIEKVYNCKLKDSGLSFEFE